MKLSILTIALAAGVMSAACSDDDNAGPSTESRVRVVHASPDAPAVDVLVDGSEVLSDVPYGNASTYLTVASGARTTDLGGGLGTSEFTDEVIARVRSKLDVWASL